MDQFKYQNIAASLTESIKARHNLFKITQLLVSLSVCSFIFSPSSLLVFLHYFKFYFSTFPFQLFTHNIDKNCMFLLCNGLLVFVGITRSFSGSSGGDQLSKYGEGGSQSEFPDVIVNEPILEEEVEEKTTEHDVKNTAAEEAVETKDCAEEVKENIEKIILVDEEQEEGSNDQSVLKEEEKKLDEETELFDAEDEEEDKGAESDQFLSEGNIEDVEEDVEEEESNMVSTEELNKKFEDFIRRMKQDLRIEAQRQLVMV